MPTNPFPPAALVAAYFRDSGGDTQDLSIPQQRQRFAAWCVENNLVPGSIFIDQAKPGSTTANRTAFHDMMHHFRNGATEAGLVIWSYSRFSRDFDDAQFYRADLRRRGYIFHSLNDDIPEGPIGRLIEAMTDWKNEQFLNDLSRDVKRGLENLVRNYGAIPGTPPRGFMRQPIHLGKHRNGKDHIVHRWIPDPDLTPLIQEAFRMRAARQPLSEIHQATHLFSAINSYRTFFTNPIYTGTLKYGPLVITNYCDPLIDPATWQAVQTVIDEHTQNKNNKTADHPRRVGSSFLLSGIVHCARCGSPLQGHTSYTSTNPFQTYLCTRAKRRRDCEFKPIPRKVLEEAVITKIAEDVLLPHVIARNEELLQKNHLKNIDRINRQRSALTKQLVATRRLISNLANTIAETGHTRTLIDTLTAYESDETALVAQISGLDRQIEPIKAFPVRDIPRLAENLRQKLRSSDPNVTKRTIKMLIKRINVDRINNNEIIGEIIAYHPP